MAYPDIAYFAGIATGKLGKPILFSRVGGYVILLEVYYRRGEEEYV